MLGQVWLAQIVIYPLFGKVGEAEYPGYHASYAKRIPRPVILPGFVSFLLPVGLAVFGPVVPPWMTVTNIAAGAAGLVVTVLLLIPRHNRLERHGGDDAVIAEMVRFNWPRTLAITIQAGVAAAMLIHVFGMN